MKIFRVIALSLSLLFFVSMFTSCSKSLVLIEPEIVTTRNDQWGMHNVIDFEKSGIKETTKIKVKSNNEQLVKYENEKLVFGSECGETDITITAGLKKVTVKVKVVSKLDLLEYRANKKDASGYDKLDYYSAKWVIHNLERFKNPSSVTLKEVYYLQNSVSKTSFDASFLIVEISAQNGFGGYGSSFYKVTSYGIEEVELDYSGFGYEYQGHTLYHYSLLGDYAIQEYIDDHY